MRTRSLSLIASLVLVGACYHVTITTGLPSNGQTIEKPWAAGFIYGLVPPAEIETAAKCPGGVAKVETQQSFLNGLVSGLTFGIFTPWDIKVSCAGRAAAANGHTIDGSSFTDVAHAIEAASDATVASGADVFVQF